MAIDTVESIVAGFGTVAVHAIDAMGVGDAFAALITVFIAKRPRFGARKPARVTQTIGIADFLPIAKGPIIAMGGFGASHTLLGGFEANVCATRTGGIAGDAGVFGGADFGTVAKGGIVAITGGATFHAQI